MLPPSYARLNTNAELIMTRRLTTLVCAAWLAALLAFTPRAGAQPAPFLRPPPGPIHIGTMITNDSIRLSWQLMPGVWQLQVQQPADTGAWTPVPAGLYTTNAMTVSATLPLTEKPALYRLRRLAPFATPALPPLPQVPPPPTNRPPPVRPPGS